MSDVLRWLVAVEILGVCFLPLTMWAMGSLPDRGYAFAKILGLLLVTYVTWIIGEAFPVVESAVLPGAVAIVAAGLGWWLWRARTLEALREARIPILIEEGLFVGGLLLLSALRVSTFGS